LLYYTARTKGKGRRGW